MIIKRFVPFVFLTHFFQIFQGLPSSSGYNGQLLTLYITFHYNMATQCLRHLASISMTSFYFLYSFVIFISYTIFIISQ